MSFRIQAIISSVAASLVAMQIPASAECQSQVRDNTWVGWTINRIQDATKYNAQTGQQSITNYSNRSTASQDASSRLESVAGTYIQEVAPATVPCKSPAPAAKAPAAAQTARPVLPKLFECKQGISNTFISEIAADAAQLPETWRNRLAGVGYRITLSRTLTDSVPAAKDLQVRGYKSTATWSQVFGMFDRLHRKVVMAELANSNEAKTFPLITLNDPATRAGIVRHEFGHAVDDYMKYYSHTDAFKAAYDKGSKRLNDQDRQILNYYLQSGNAGKEEMFAELFASISSDACDPRADQLLRAKFPEAFKLVSKIALDGPTS